MSFGRLIPQQRRSLIIQDMRNCFLLRLKNAFFDFFLIYTNIHSLIHAGSNITNNLWSKKLYEMAKK